MSKLWEYLKWIVPVIGLVDEAWKQWDPEGHAKTAGGLSSAIAGIGEESEELTTTTGELSEATALLTESEGLLGEATSGAADAVNSLGGCHAGHTQ